MKLVTDFLAVAGLQITTIIITVITIITSFLQTAMNNANKEQVVKSKEILVPRVVL